MSLYADSPYPIKEEIVALHNAELQSIAQTGMYRNLKDQTVARFGNEHFEKWDRAYSFFVRLYTSGELGGGRFLARKYAQVDPRPN